MGLTHVKVKVRKDRKAKRVEALEFLVDSGAVYSVVPRGILDRLGVEPYEKESFFLADGTEVTRDVGDAYFAYRGRGGYSKVVFGEEGDCNLLGVTTLEAFGFILDPLRRELRPMPMVLMPTTVRRGIQE